MGFVDKVYEKSIPALEKAMDLYLQRNDALSSNISNVETPGYRATDVDFGVELEKAFSSQETTGPISRTNPRHFEVESKNKSHLVSDYSGATRADGNNVDLDIQIGKMLFNSGEYNKAATILRKQLNNIKNFIRNARG